MSDVDVPLARPADLDWQLVWSDDNGSLRGRLRATNVGDHTVRLGRKSGLVAVGADGTHLDAPTVITLEGRFPGSVDIDPGKSASAPAGWAGWSGPPASGDFVVSWQGGDSIVTATGPRQPERPGPPHLTTSWFSLDQ